MKANIVIKIKHKANIIN